MTTYTSITVYISGYLVRCALTVKDNNVCLTDGSKGFETCTKEDNTPQCGFWEYTFQCCPETCRGKTGRHGIVMPIGNFTQKACRKLFDYSIPDIEGILGRCKYPFYSRIEDCSIQGTICLRNIFDKLIYLRI